MAGKVAVNIMIGVAVRMICRKDYLFCCIVEEVWGGRVKEGIPTAAMSAER